MPPGYVPRPGEEIRFSLFLDTQGASEIILFSVAIVFDPTVIQYEPSLSQLNDYYPLYAPAIPKSQPATWLVPNTNPPQLWPNPPAGMAQLDLQFLENSLNPTLGTSTNEYLGEVVFTSAGAGGPSYIDFTFATDTGIFLIEQGMVQTDVWPFVTTEILWAPEPSSSLLMGFGVAMLAWRRAVKR